MRVMLPILGFTLFLSITLSIGGLHCPCESHTVYGVHISYGHCLYGIWLWGYTSCMQTQFTSANTYYQPTLMTDPGLGTGDKAMKNVKNTDQVPVFVELTLSRTSSPFMEVSLFMRFTSGFILFRGLHWHRLSRRVSLCVWSYMLLVLHWA